ncbi:MAG: hypothetical protein CSB13_05020 [Chloroflexi bacterium]|nr:MAG: hypothetical protein CSB13_05020 [Chloroflexota bacterium]
MKLSLRIFSILLIAILMLAACTATETAVPEAEEAAVVPEAETQPAEPTAAPVEEATEVEVEEPTAEAEEATAEPVASATAEEVEPTVLQVGAKCGPSPHAMPLFIALAQHNSGQFENGQIEFVPVTEPAQMTALLSNGQVDSMVGFIAQTANIYQKGGVENLRLLSVPLWQAFYVVGTEDVTSWADVQGEAILMPDAQSGPSQLARTSMQQAGFDPEADFEIQNMPANQIIQMMLAGQARTAVVSEPFSTMLINKSRSEGDTPLNIAPIDLYDVYQTESAWPADALPMEGFLATQETLDNPNSLALLQEFETAYYDAVDFMEANPAEASEIVVAQLGEYCDSNMKAKPLEMSISSGRLLFNPYPAADLQPDLSNYIASVTGLDVDDAFFAPAEASVAPGEPFPVAETTAATEPNPDLPTLRVGTKCGPTGHAMPLFTMMAQQGVAFDEFNLEYVPVTDSSQMAALLTNAQVDAVLAQVVNTAKMQKTAVPDLRLWSTSMSNGFYLVAEEGISSWEDLVGKRILMPGPNSGPTNLVTAAMREAGYDRETDFIVEYLPPSQIVQMLVAGEAPAGVIAEPFVTMVMNKSKAEGGTPIAPAPMDLYSLYGSELWNEGELPLDGILVLQPVLDDADTHAAFEAFVAAYNDAIDFMMANPTEASQLIASQLTEQCDSMMQPPVIQKTLENGRLLYTPYQAADLLPDLDAYIELVLGQEVNDAFYAQP